MHISKKLQIVILIMAILFLGLILFFLNGKNPDPLRSNIDYYEFIREDFTCQPSCLIEYIVHSNGLVFTKNETKTNDDKKTEVGVGVIEPAKAVQLIKDVKSLIGDAKSTGVDCVKCRLYHLFYGNGLQTNALVENIDDAPEFMEKVRVSTQIAFKEMKPLDPFFVHFVYTPYDQVSVDYHFYPDGTVLKEEFGKNNGELLTSKIFSMSETDVSGLKSLIRDDFFISRDNLTACIEAGLLWGYLEIKKGDKYNVVYTCGRGSSAADNIFETLMDKEKNGRFLK